MITLVLFWGFWATFIAVVMLVDRNMRTDEDFTPTPGGYFALAAITPFLVLPIYFFTSRRNSTTGYRVLASLTGLVLTFVCCNIASFHMTMTMHALVKLV